MHCAPTAFVAETVPSLVVQRIWGGGGGGEDEDEDEDNAPLAGREVVRGRPHLVEYYGTA